MLPNEVVEGLNVHTDRGWVIRGGDDHLARFSTIDMTYQIIIRALKNEWKVIWSNDYQNVYGNSWDQKLDIKVEKELIGYDLGAHIAKELYPAMVHHYRSTIEPWMKSSQETYDKLSVQAEDLKKKTGLLSEVSSFTDTEIHRVRGTVTSEMGKCLRHWCVDYYRADCALVTLRGLTHEEVIAVLSVIGAVRKE